MKIKIIGDGFGARSLSSIFQNLIGTLIFTFFARTPVPILCTGRKILVPQLSNPSKFWGGLLGMRMSDVKINLASICDN